MSVFAPSLSSLYKQISGYGIDPDPLFKQEGLDPALMYDSNARVPYAVTDRIAAVALHTTKRNLHRKLQAQGTSFKQLLTETRQELAEQYINDSTLTLTEISFLLGFSEASSFTRSYKRWTGLPPSEARRRTNQHP